MSEKTKATRTAKVNIYKVEANDQVRLIRATSRTKAMRFLMKGLKATIPTQDELIALTQNSVVVEDALEVE